MVRIVWGMCVVLMMFGVLGCASYPDSITPISVASSEYEDMTCSEMTDELLEVQYHTDLFGERQRLTANGDVLGVFLFLIPVGSLVGEDEEGQYAIWKGEQIALTRAMKRKECEVETFNTLYEPPSRDEIDPDRCWFRACEAGREVIRR